MLRQNFVGNVRCQTNIAMNRNFDLADRVSIPAHQKLEMGKRLLLDPRLQVAEIADRCGFCNPAYFASVFKKHMHCTPRAYARQPQRWAAMEPATADGTRSMI